MRTQSQGAFRSLIVPSLLLIFGCGGSEVSIEQSGLQQSASVLPTRLIPVVDLESPQFLGTLQGEEDTQSCPRRVAIQAFVERCGSLREVYLGAWAGPGRSGTSFDPVSSLSEALSICRQEPCHIYAAEGTYEVSRTWIRGCTMLEGGYRVSGGTWMRTQGRSRFVGIDDELEDGDWVGLLNFAGTRQDASTVLVRNVEVVAQTQGVMVFGPGTRGAAGVEHFSLQNAEVSGSYNAVAFSGTTGKNEICGAELRGGYSGLEISRASGRTDVFSSVLTGGYAAATAAWSSSGITIHDSDLWSDAIALELAWSSFDVQIASSTIRASDTGVSISWGCSNVQVVDNEIEAGRRAVSVGGAPSRDIEIAKNTVLSGTLPAEDPSRGIVVRENKL